MARDPTTLCQQEEHRDLQLVCRSCFLRARTWLAIENPELLAEDTAAFARLEGLEAHAQAALARVHKHKNKGPDS